MDRTQAHPARGRVHGRVETPGFRIPRADASRRADAAPR